MNFLSPMAFWFAATIPVVVLFYLLKRRRVVRLVSSTVLWQRFLAETQASAPFQKLRRNWLLVLQILLLILAILALARPYFAGKSPGGRLLVTILDASASMQSTDVAPTRFDAAREQALKLVNSLTKTDRMIVLVAAAQAEVKQSPTSEKAALRRALESARPLDTPTRLTEALKLAETLIANYGGAEVHLFSDGAVPALNEFENRALPLVYHKVGVRGGNLAVTGIDVKPSPDDPLEKAVFANLSNFSTNARQSQVEFRFNGQLVEARPVSFGPMETQPQVLVTPQDEPGVFSVRLTDEDDLAVDNEASVVSLLPQPVKVLLFSPGNSFLIRALRSIPNVELSLAQTPDASTEGFDVTVLDTAAPIDWPDTSILAFRTFGTNWFESAAELEAPPIVDWKGNHPVLRFVNFDNVQMASSLAVDTPSWAVSLVDSPQRSLMVAGEIEGRRVVWAGFDLVQTTWPLRISFPIFIANAVAWLNPAVQTADQLMVQAGAPFQLGLSETVSSVEIERPDGRIQSWPVNGTRREILFGETTQKGVYKVKAGTNETLFAVNLTDPVESDTAPKDEIHLGEYVAAADAPLRQANMEIWRWIAAAALAALLFEWWYYHRRTV